MSYLRYLCLFAHSGVQHILNNCAVFLFCFSSSCVSYVAMQFLWIVLFFIAHSAFF